VRPGAITWAPYEPLNEERLISDIVDIELSLLRSGTGDLVDATCSPGKCRNPLQTPRIFLFMHMSFLFLPAQHLQKMGKSADTSVQRGFAGRHVNGCESGELCGTSLGVGEQVARARPKP
jgi:hypothetical protein